MKNIFRIISKNLKLLFRARASALIIILAPLLVVLLVGIAFDNSNVFGLTIGVFTNSTNDATTSLLDALKDQQFNIIRYNSQETCVDEIKQGRTNTCIILPEDLSFESNKQNEVTFYVDYSKINLVYMITDTLSSRFGSTAREISKNLTAVLIEKLDKSRTELDAKKPVIAQVKTDSGEANVKVQSVSGDLASLDFTFSDSSLPIDQVKNSLSKAKSDLTTDLDTAKSKVSSAKSKSSDAGAIADLDAALESINEAKSTLSANNTNATGTLEKIEESLTNIQNELNVIKSQLVQAQQFKEGASTSLSEAKAKLDAGTDSLNQIESTIDTLISEINSIKVTDPSAIAQPIVTNLKPVSSQSTYLNYLFPSLMVLVVMFVSILVGTTLVMMEKHSPAYFRNFITPTRDIVFILATYLTNMLLVLIQVAIMLLIALYFFSGQITFTIPMILLVLLLVGTFFTLAGMVIGYIFASEETATLAAVSTGTLLLFLSSVIVPIESMPDAIRQMAVWNPFVVGERVLREVVLFNPGFNVIVDDLGILTIYSIVLFLFIWGSQKIMSKHYLHHIMYKHHKKKHEEMQKREKGHFEKKTTVKQVQKEAATQTKQKKVLFRI